MTDRAKTQHQLLVEEFMLKAGQDVPDKPCIPSEEVRLLRAKLILEECLETIQALGVTVYFNGEDFTSPTLRKFEFNVLRNADIQEVVDGCCDIKVVTTGTLSAFGIADHLPQQEVDESNLSKFRPPICPNCGERLEDDDLMGEDVGVDAYWDCSNCSRVTTASIVGCYRREDGKWIKPNDWQPPDWDSILREQGYNPNPNAEDDGVVYDEYDEGPDLAHLMREWAKEQGVDPDHAEDSLGSLLQVLKQTKSVSELLDEIPVGPGDGLVRIRGVQLYPQEAYEGHRCPHKGCGHPANDKMVKRLCIGKIRAAHCPNCSNYYGATTKSKDRPRLICLISDEQLGLLSKPE